MILISQDDVDGFGDGGGNDDDLTTVLPPHPPDHTGIGGEHGCWNVSLHLGKDKIQVEDWTT